jgi:hypothetical protein
MEGNYFKDIIYKMNTRFNEPKIKNKNTLVITREDFKSLSSFELQTINTIAQIYDLIKNNEVISFDTLISVVNKLAKHGTDAEKIYLLGLFFPEKLKAMNIHQLNPFPIPTHTLHQEFTFNIIPNAFGNFVVPLAIKVTGVYKKYESYFNEATKNVIKGGDDIFKFPGIEFSRTILYVSEKITRATR